MAGSDQVPGGLNPSMYHQPYNLSLEMSFVQSVLTDELKLQYSGDHDAAHWQGCHVAENTIQKDWEAQDCGALQRRKRMIFTKAQLHDLELFFQTNQYPDINDREALAKCLHIPESRVQVWFQNRRAKSRRESAKPKKKPVLIEYFPDGKTVKRPAKRRLTLPSQRKPVKTAKWVKGLKHSKLNSFPQAPCMGYHPFSYQSPEVPHASGKAYCQNVSYGTNMWVHQQVENRATDLNRGSFPKPNLLEYDWFQENQTITSAEGSVSPITVDLNSGGLDFFCTRLPFQLPISHNDLYNQSYTAVDSDLSDITTDSDWEQSLLQSEPGDVILIP